MSNLTREYTIRDIIEYLHVDWATFEDLTASGPAPATQLAATPDGPGTAARPEPTTVCDFLDHLTQPYSLDGAQSRKFQYRADRPRICMVQLRCDAGRPGARVADQGWKREVPRKPTAPWFVLPPWAQPEKTEMIFHCCDVRDLVYLLGDHRRACDRLLGSQQRLGLLHVLHALESTDDDEDVFSTVVVKAIVERSWGLVQCQYWLKFCTAMVFIVGLAWFTYQTNNYEPVSMCVVNILTFISALNMLMLGAEVLSFGLEFDHSDILRYFTVWNSLSCLSEVILLCALIWLRHEPELFLHADIWYNKTDNSTPIYNVTATPIASTILFAKSQRHPGLLTLITIVKWYDFVIYTMALQIGYCVVPAYRALISTDSISFLMFIGVLWFGASMCLYTMPFKEPILFYDALQIMFRVATVGDGDSIFQSAEERPKEFPEGDYGNLVILVFYILFVIGLGVVVSLQLYVSILACSYEDYRSRAEHHYNQFLENVIEKCFLQSCLLDRLVCGNVRCRRLEELDNLFSGQQLETEELESEELDPPETIPGLLIACRQDDSAVRRKNSRRLQTIMHTKLRGCGFLVDCRDKPLLANFVWRSRNTTTGDGV